MKCNENKFADVILVKLHPIVNVFPIRFRAIILHACFVSVKYGYSDHDSTYSAKWERNFSLLSSSTAAFPCRSEELNWFLESQATNNLWIPAFDKTISMR